MRGGLKSVADLLRGYPACCEIARRIKSVHRCDAQMAPSLESANYLQASEKTFSQFSVVYMSAARCRLMQCLLAALDYVMFQVHRWHILLGVAFGLRGAWSTPAPPDVVAQPSPQSKRPKTLIGGELCLIDK